MRSVTGIYRGILIILSGLTLVEAASSWGFTDATVSIQGKGSGVGSGFKEKFADGKPPKEAINLRASDTLKIILTTQDGKTARRPHQAFLTVKNIRSGIETSYPFLVKENGKGKVELTYRDIPSQLLVSADPLSASLIIASFGSSKAYNRQVFELSIIQDPNMPQASTDKPLRYGKLPEIHHIFKPDPKSPPKIVSLFFTAIVLAVLPILLFAWFSLGANVNHLSKAFGNAPVSHSLFFGSIVAMEGIFFMYYTSWNLFRMLPAATAVGTVTYLSGSRALSEVQERRLAGLR